MKDREEDIFSNKINKLTSDNNYLKELLNLKNSEMIYKLEAYNKAKHGTFADKINFLFDKE